MKENAMARLEFELAYFGAVVQQVNHNATGTRLVSHLSHVGLLRLVECATKMKEALCQTSWQCDRNIEHINTYFWEEFFFSKAERLYKMKPVLVYRLLN